MICRDKLAFSGVESTTIHVWPPCSGGSELRESFPIAQDPGVTGIRLSLRPARDKVAALQCSCFATVFSAAPGW